MNPALVLLILIFCIFIYIGYRSEKTQGFIENTLFSNILAPIQALLNDFYSNSGLVIDDIGENYITVNTMYKNLYGLKLEGGSNTPVYFNMDAVKRLYKTYQNAPNSFFWYVILKDEFYHRQYIFSYNEDLLKTIGEEYSLKLLSGEELANVVLDLFLQNEFFIQDKDVHRNISLNFHSKIESNYQTFTKLARENIYQNLNKTDLYQSYKTIEGMQKTDIQKLLKMNFKGAVWTYFDIGQKNIENHLSRLINYSKWTGNKKVFMELKEAYDVGEQDLVISNSTAHFVELDKSIIGNFGSALKVDFLKKDIFKKNTLRKTPFKFRDSEFDFLAPLDFLGNYISCVQKARTKKADFWGLDKNGGFVNYSFAHDNDNPHAFIIANTGAGKSYTIQKILTTMLDVDYDNAKAKKLHKDNIIVRYYDIGYSSENLITFLKQNIDNNIAHVESELANFTYNLVNIDERTTEAFEADLIFATDLANIILSSQPGTDILNSSEVGLFKKVLAQIYKTRDYQHYRVRDIKNVKLKDKLLKLGHTENSYLKDFDDNFEFLKKPLLIDIIKFATIQTQNEQLSHEDRKDFENLARKLKAIDSLGYFSNFDTESIVDADFLSMDLNNYKENSLFTAIFVSIFQKVYLKDRNYAIQRKREQKSISKKIYIIEESANFFRVPYFCTMLEKLALEARKYGVHLILIAQQLEHIPKQILKVVDTRIFLLTPAKKMDLISEVKNYFDPDKNVIQSLNDTERYELCIWYLKGVFNMKLQVTEFENKLFTSNPNDIAGLQNV